MPQTISSRRRHTPTAAAVLLVVLTSLVLAACGSSSKSSSSSTASASAKPSTTGGAASAPTSRFAAIRECLQKNGITLPKRTPGKRPSPGAGGFLGSGGGPQLPKGVTRAQYETAVKKCGGFPRGAFTGAIARFSKASRQALAKFAACMHENGVNVPAANTSGKGPVFSNKGLNTNTAKFKAAEMKCDSDLPGFFRARPGAGRAPGSPGSPPSAAG
jgi:hypothetical protein